MTRYWNERRQLIFFYAAWGFGLGAVAGAAAGLVIVLYAGRKPLTVREGRLAC